MKRIAVVTPPVNGGRIFSATFKTTRELRKPRLQRKQERNAGWLRTRAARALAYARSQEQKLARQLKHIAILVKQAQDKIARQSNEKPQA